MIFNFLNYGILMIFIKHFSVKFLNFLRYVRFVDNTTNFDYKIVECCLVLRNFSKKLYRFCNFQILKKVFESPWRHIS